MATINRPTTKTIISTTGWGIPITDEVNRISPLVDARTPTGWFNVTFQNNWKNYGAGYQTVQYRKEGDVVRVRGLMGVTGTPGFTVCFQLPVGYRAPTAFITGVAADDGLQRINVGSDGNFQVFNPPANRTYFNWETSYSTTA